MFATIHKFLTGDTNPTSYEIDDTRRSIGRLIDDAILAAFVAVVVLAVVFGLLSLAGVVTL